MKVIGLAGSVRPSSFSRKTLDLLAKIYLEHGTQIQIIDLYDLKLPFCDGSTHYLDFPDVEKMQKIFHEADGILLVTPEYHGCISGAMKNALDLMSDRELKDKVIALAAVMSGTHSNSAIGSLRNVCRQVHSWVIPQQLVVANVNNAFNDKGYFSNEKLLTRAHELVVSHLHAIGKLRSLS